MWILRRLKLLEASEQELVDIYKRQILCVLELAVPAWAGGLTKAQIRKIERVQKCAFSIILGFNYSGYNQAMPELKMETLQDRRIKLCTNFASKALKHDRYKKWFIESIPNHRVNTRNRPPAKRLKEPAARTARFYNSPIPFLTRLLNDKYVKIDKKNV